MKRFSYLKPIKTKGIFYNSKNTGGMRAKAKITNGFVYAILGDGEIQEGQIWEAAMSANKFKLNNLITFLDYNKLQIDGSNDEVMPVAPVKEKFEAFGWYTQEINGHDYNEIMDAVNNAKMQEKPSIIIANTIKGKGVSFMENKAEWHGKAPSIEEYERASEELI